jgi:hypothetical protein
MNTEKFVEYELAGEIKVPRENLQQIVHHKSHMSWRGSNPIVMGDGKPTTNCLSYGTALLILQNSVIQYRYEGDVRVDTEYKVWL